MSIDSSTPIQQSTKKGIFFAGSLVLALVLTSLMREPSFTESQTYVLFLLLFSVGLWLTEAVPPFAVGLFIIVFLVYTLGYSKFTTTPQDIHIYTNTLSSSVIWLMLGGFFLASAMTKTKLDMDLIQVTLKVCGQDPKWILFGMMLITMVFSMLISNTAATAMVIAALMPLIVQLGKQSPVSKGLIIGIPIAATTGGMGTMIGSPPNAIATGAIIGAGQSMSFVTWMAYGIPLTVVLTFLAWLVVVRLFMRNSDQLNPESKTTSGAELAKESPIKRWVVIIVLLGTLALWLTNPIHGLSAAAVAAVPLVALTLTGILNSDDIRGLGWDTLILVAGGLSLGTGLQQTGLLDHYAAQIAALPVAEMAFYFLLAYGTMMFSNVMSSTATSTVLIPLGISILPQHVVEVSMIIGLSASCGLLLPVSTPPNAIAFSTGLIQQKDFRLGGVLVGLLGPALIVLWVLAIT